MKNIKTPFTKSDLKKLKAGDEVLLSGIIYTARDQAHKRLVDLLKKGKKIPLDLNGQVIYYCGPTAAPKTRPIGSCGPTTSSRMDNFIEPLLKKGLAAMIGKGRRSSKAKGLIKKYKSVYFIAPSGCGALLAKRVVENKLVGFAELGPEAICKLKVNEFPLIVGIDSKGNDIYGHLT